MCCVVHGRTAQKCPADCHTQQVVPALPRLCVDKEREQSAISGGASGGSQTWACRERKKRGSCRSRRSWVSTGSQELVSRPVCLGCSSVGSSQGLRPSHPGPYHFPGTSRVPWRGLPLLACLGACGPPLKGPFLLLMRPEVRYREDRDSD